MAAFLIIVVKVLFSWNSEIPYVYSHLGLPVKSLRVS